MVPAIKENCVMFLHKFGLVLGVTIAGFFLLPRESCRLLILERGLILVTRSELSGLYVHRVTVTSCQNPFCGLSCELYIMQQCNPPLQPISLPRSSSS